MVMKRNAMRKNLRQSILSSFGRYVAIMSIIALGAALFSGLLMTKTDMVATGQDYVDKQNMFDIRLVNSYGWAQQQLDRTEKLEGIVDAEGVVYQDYIVTRQDESKVYRFYTIPERINQLSLRGGRMPEKPNECVIDGFKVKDSVLGSTIRIADSNDEDVLESIRYREFTVVGYVASPLYMDMNRGTTSVGTGSLDNIVFVPKEAMDVDYYTEIHLTIPGENKIYSDSYNDTLDEAVKELEPEAEFLSKQRFSAMKRKAELEYSDGLREYEDGLQELEDAKVEFEQELADAYQELVDGQQEIDDNRKKLGEAEVQLYNTGVDLEKKLAQVYQGQAQLEANRPSQAQRQAAEAGKTSLESAFGIPLATLASMLDSASSNISELNATIAELQQQMNAATEEEQKQAIGQQIVALETQLGLIQAVVSQEAAIRQTYQGIIGIQQFDAKEAQLKAAEEQILSGQEEVKKKITEVYDNYKKLDDAQQEIDDGWVEYYDGKAEGEQEIADAEQELADAKIELADARQEIDDLKSPQSFVMDRNSNIGYSSLDSSSDIVAGVSRVFPVFFLLVASLVCITTMTRMIEEERTQIGTLKALGYSNIAIISKYMIYAGSGAVLGCGLGLVIGSTFFPILLWTVYKIMLHIQPHVVLTIDWPLCVAVIVVYTGVMLFVTWYCCRRTLREEPAELIRPKAPELGKKILLERLPLWNHISFLNKVTIRNIFRYRQRLAMMLVGIGGCTALLVTGFGLRDSIVNVVDYQFRDVSPYDLQVYFEKEPTQEEYQQFCEEIKDLSDGTLLYHQSSVEISAQNQTREIYMITAEDGIESFQYFRRNGEDLPLPGEDEVLLSIGVAEAMGIQEGDTVRITNADMQALDLRVSGIYENYVYNYAVVAPKTIENQWGAAPERLMAYVNIAEGQDIHLTSAKIMNVDTVMNVSVSEDVAEMVKAMMQAMDLLNVVIVTCAGLLAIIVIYNLTNINIKERIREIATIKVLGFNASETAAYVFKENIILTVAGTVVGLFLGNLLLAFVMSQVKIDMVWFKAVVLPPSYLWSVLLTFLSSCAVNFIFYFKLDKINMAEALKSVE